MSEERLVERFVERLEQSQIVGHTEVLVHDRSRPGQVQAQRIETFVGFDDVANEELCNPIGRTIIADHVSPSSAPNLQTIGMEQQRVGAGARNEHNATVGTARHDAADRVRFHRAMFAQPWVLRLQVSSKFEVLLVILAATETQTQRC